MNTKFYQACFTRVDTGNMSAGWQVVNTSSDMSQSMVAFFESNEKSNDVSVTKQNADGSPLRVTKIICDAKNIALTQVQYGLSDNSGRSRFFSHGYIASDPYEVLKDPQQVLGLSDANFHFSLEETENAPDLLTYDGQFSEEAIFEKYGWKNSDVYLKFVKCALYPLFSSTQTTVFIKTDGSRQMAMELLYIIYHTIPFSMRSRVTASTYAKPMGANSMYVFTDELPSVGSRVDPLTGDNNILSDGYEKRLERYRFPLFYAQHMPMAVEIHDGYYDKIEKTLEVMGDVHLNKPEAIRLAFMTLTDTSIADDEIGGVLYDWLSLSVPMNDGIIELVEKFVRLAIKKNVQLSDNVITLLQKRLKETNSQSLRKVYLEFDAHRLIRAGFKAHPELMKYRKIPVYFRDLCEVLKQSEAGNLLLNTFYLDGAKHLVNSASCSYSDMIAFLDECSYVKDIEEIRSLFFDKCFAIAQAKQRRGDHFKNVYKEYGNAARQIYPIMPTAGKQLAAEYDELFRTAFAEERVMEYEEFYYTHSREFPWSVDFLEIWKEIGNQRFKYVPEYLERLTGRYNQMLTPEDVKAFASRLFDHAVQNDAASICTNVGFWSKFSDILGYDLIELMAKKRADVLCDPELLYASLKMDKFWRRAGVLEYAYDACERYYKEHGDQSAVTKQTIRLLKDEIKAAKKDEKASDKHAKQKDEEAKSRKVEQSEKTEKSEKTLSFSFFQKKRK